MGSIPRPAATSKSAPSNKKQKPTGKWESAGVDLEKHPLRLNSETQKQPKRFINTTQTKPYPLAISHKPITINQEEGALADRPPSLPDGPARPSMAAAICVAMKAAGLASVNPSHPDLLVLIDKGADIGLFVAVAQECVAKQKTFPYALATVKGRMADAAVLSDSALVAPHKHAGLGNKQEALEQRNRQVAQAWAAGDDA